jgi:DNA repair protein SbcC/Rad50
MLIRSVRLENIRSYTNEKIDFPEGSTLLSGDIGSGKSTILLAIEFALFGLNKGSGNSLLRHGKKEGSVELNFSVDGKDVIIKRMLKRNNDDARQTAGYIIIDEMKSELTPVELKSKIIELLGYPKDSLAKKDMIYTYTVYTPQEEMKQILADDPEIRVEILRKVFGIDRYKRIRDNCGFLTKELKEKRAMLEGRSEDIEVKIKEKALFEGDAKKADEKLKEIYSELEKERKNVLETKLKLKEHEGKMRTFSSLKMKLENSEKNLAEKEKLLQRIKEDISTIQIQAEGLKKKLSEIDIIAMPLKSEDDIEKEISEKLDMINSIARKKELVREKLNNNAAKAEEISRRIEEIEKSNEELRGKKPMLEKLKQETLMITNLDEDIEKIMTAIKEIDSRISESRVHIEDSDRTIEDMKKIDSCPKCLQKVSEMHKRAIIEKESRKSKECRVEMLIMNESRKEKEDLLKRNKEYYSELLKKQNMLERLKAEMGRLDGDEKKIEQERALIAILREDRTKLKVEFEELCVEDIEKLSRSILNFRKMLEIIRSNRIKEEKRESMRKLAEDKEKQVERLLLQEKETARFIEEEKEAVIRTKESMKDIGEIEEIYNKINEELEMKMKDERKVELEKATLENNILAINRRIKELWDEIKLKEDARNEMKKISEMQNWIDNYFTELMGIIERQIMANIYWQFNELFQQWFNQLIEDESIEARIDEQFTPVIQQNGYDTKIEFLSGGERTSAALAYRLALNKVINRLVGHIKTNDLLILDEPTDGFSSEQLDKVRDVLDELDVRQLIVVSHESKIESFVDNVIRINKNEHESRVAG